VMRCDADAEELTGVGLATHWTLSSLPKSNVSVRIVCPSPINPFTIATIISICQLPC
jgi:hypothetical protein